MIDSGPINKIADEVSNLAPKVYDDLAQPVAREIGQVAGRTIKALLAPLRGMLWGWERIEQVVTEGLEKRLKDIPEEQRKAPEPEIAIPLMQALGYTAQNETLREMYLNLLANSMDTAKEKDVHPSFVEMIKQMSSLDAKVFEKLTTVEGYQQVVNPNIGLKGEGKFFPDAAPEWFIGWTVPNHDVFEVSASLIRLSKFGIIDLLLEKIAVGGTNYEALRNHSDLINLLNAFQQKYPSIQLEITTIDSVVFVNEYGKQFKKACL